MNLSDACELTILMPCLNEAETIGTCIRKANGYLERSGVRGEVLIADNLSDDGSPEIATKLNARVITAPQRGYGSALMAGIREAHGRYVIMGDADSSYDFGELDPFVGKLREGYDLVMGNRFAGGIAKGAMPFLHRYLGNPVLSFLGRLFFGSPVNDFYCGLRGFRKASIEDLALRGAGMEFASEMVVKATLKGLKITEVPTTLSPDGRSRPPHLRRWRDGWRGLRFLLLFSPRWLFLYPGAALMALGWISMMILLQGPLKVAGVSLDVNTLVYTSAAIVCGFQLLVFGIFAKIFAINQGLLPDDPRLARISSVLSLEIGVMVGGVLILAGLVTSVYALNFWERASFGPLNTRQSLRIVVPAATAVVLGMQIASSSFFLSLLGLSRDSSRQTDRLAS